MIRWLGLAVLGLMLPAWMSAPADACQCHDVPTVLEAAESSDLIFVGTVLSVVSVRYESGQFVRQRVMLRVDEGLKNASMSRYALDTPAPESCGYPFEIGRQYFVYASAFREGFTTSLCGRTRPVAWAGDDRHAMGR